MWTEPEGAGGEDSGGMAVVLKMVAVVLHPNVSALILSFFSLGFDVHISLERIC